MAEESQNITLDCGIAYARLEAWLDDELALPRHDEGLWVYECEASPCCDGSAHESEACRDDSTHEAAACCADPTHAAPTCCVGLSRLENRTLGNFSLERTQLSIDGDAEAVAVFMKLFTLRFISAGG